ncbi:hypothetical protein CYMTET_11474 [Cymbomonas tetramitiformis]|uniref:Nudix hydrolase domain-containing protein n=1 Tax=Cymbomonas tetramitiformis TaxID=36881 RepID=A0AAE0GM98_9CHLO|nr:hypothetical protein CYMTET_11474 [Cymbomonas tetramitiformis]
MRTGERMWRWCASALTGTVLRNRHRHALMRPALPHLIQERLLTTPFFRIRMRCSASSGDDPLAESFPITKLPYRGALLDLRISASAASSFSTCEQEGNAPMSPEDFRARLCRTVADLRADGFLSCMLQLPIELAGLAAVAHQAEGFVFHHCPPGVGSEVVLKLWLQDAEEDKVPPFATHQVGCAGMVINERGELLVVKEAHTSGSSARKPQWKLPGGLLDLGESFEDGSCREVFEETGIETTFSSILCFWHRHGLLWGKSDLYVVCLLRPRTNEIQADPGEISDCAWIPMDEFVRSESHPLILKVCDVLLERTKAAPEGPFVEGGAIDLTPIAEVKRFEVRWPEREPYSTYFPIPRDGA